MHITTPTELGDVLWEGLLEPPRVMRSLQAVRASIGKPEQWAAGELLGNQWKPPAGASRYYLVRLAFSLRAQGSTPVASADFYLRLHPQGTLQAIVYDAFPREQLEEEPRSITLGIGPEFKFAGAEATLAKAETTIDFGRAVPIIRSDGLAESEFCWHYAAQSKHPLEGSRMMYAVLALPPEMPSALATLELVAAQSDALGFLRLTTPQRDKLRWVFGEKKGTA